MLADPDHRPETLILTFERANYYPDLTSIDSARYIELSPLGEATRPLHHRELKWFLFSLPDVKAGEVREDNRNKERFRPVFGSDELQVTQPWTFRWVLQCKKCDKILFVVWLQADEPFCLLRLRGVCAHVHTDEDPLWTRGKEENLMQEWLLDCGKGRQRYADAADRPPKLKHFRPFGRWLLQRKFVPPESRRWMREASFSASGLRKLLRREANTLSLDDFIDTLPGFTRARVTNTTAAIYQYHGRDLVGFTWIPGWAWPAYKRMNYVELDGSFATHPFTYCIPQGVIKNEGVPLGFSMNTSENSFLFSWFMGDLKEICPEPTEFVNKAVLSDKGGGVTKFCEGPPPSPQYNCHRHLIGNFSASSAGGRLATDALRIRSERVYVELRGQLLADADALVEIGLMKASDAAKFKEFIPEDPKLFVHGLWHRIALGISSCDNHCEGFHSVINKAVRKFFRGCLPERLKAIYDCIVSKFQRFGTGRPKQIKAAIRKLQSYHAAQVPQCDRQDCVEFQLIMTSRFGLGTFPCKHTVDAWTPEDLSLAEITPTENFPNVHVAQEISHTFHPKFLQAGRCVNDEPQPEQNLPETFDDVTLMLEDESEPVNPHFVLEARDKREVRHIVSGILSLKKDAHHPDRLDPNDLHIDVWMDLVGTFGRTPPGSDRAVVIAKRTALWWKWARDGGERPIAAHTFRARPA